jgi:hypothetical protein
MHAHNYKLILLHVILFLVHWTINAYGSTLVSFALYELCPYLYRVRICPTLLCLFLLSPRTWWKGSSHSLRVPVCQVCTIELFFSFPRMLHWQQFNLSNSFVFVCLSLHIVEGMNSQPLCCVLPSIYHFPHQMLFSIGNMYEFIDVNFNLGSN